MHPHDLPNGIIIKAFLSAIEMVLARQLVHLLTFAVSRDDGVHSPACVLFFLKTSGLVVSAFDVAHQSPVHPIAAVVPGWKAYFTHQDETAQAGLRAQYDFHKYQ